MQGVCACFHTHGQSTQLASLCESTASALPWSSTPSIQHTRATLRLVPRTRRVRRVTVRTRDCVTDDKPYLALFAPPAWLLSRFWTQEIMNRRRRAAEGHRTSACACRRNQAQQLADVRRDSALVGGFSPSPAPAWRWRWRGGGARSGLQYIH